MHVRMLFSIERVLPHGVVLVNLSLQALVHVWMRQKTIREARECQRGRVCPCDNREDTVVYEMFRRRRRLVRKVLVVLWQTQRISDETGQVKHR